MNTDHQILTVVRDSLSNAQIAEHYKNCIKLSSQNVSETCVIVHIHTCTFLYMYIGLVRESPHILVWYSCSLHYIIVVYVFFFFFVISAMDTIYLM